MHKHITQNRIQNHHWRTQPAAQGQCCGVNVGDSERILSALAGGALTLYGLRRRSTIGLGLAGAGIALLYRGLSGHCSIYQTLKLSTAPENVATPADSELSARVPVDWIDVASEESFPASDAPGWR